MQVTSESKMTRLVSRSLKGSVTVNTCYFWLSNGISEGVEEVFPSITCMHGVPSIMLCLIHLLHLDNVLIVTNTEFIIFVLLSIIFIITRK